MNIKTSDLAAYLFKYKLVPPEEKGCGSEDSWLARLALATRVSMNPGQVKGVGKVILQSTFRDDNRRCRQRSGALSSESILKYWDYHWIAFAVPDCPPLAQIDYERYILDSCRPARTDNLEGLTSNYNGMSLTSRPLYHAINRNVFSRKMSEINIARIIEYIKNDGFKVDHITHLVEVFNSLPSDSTIYKIYDNDFCRGMMIKKSFPRRETKLRYETVSTEPDPIGFYSIRLDDFQTIHRTVRNPDFLNQELNQPIREL